MTTRALNAAERQDIAQRHEATCDLPAVTVCPPCVYTLWDDIGHKGAMKMQRMKRKRDKGLAKMQGKRAVK